MDRKSTAVSLEPETNRVAVLMGMATGVGCRNWRCVARDKDASAAPASADVVGTMEKPDAIDWRSRSSASLSVEAIVADKTNYARIWNQYLAMKLKRAATVGGVCGVEGGVNEKV